MEAHDGNYSIRLLQALHALLRTEEARIPHGRGSITGCLKMSIPGSSVAVETIGDWLWVVGEIEAAGSIVGKGAGSPILTERGLNWVSAWD